jgi:hypothetical protein
MAFKEQLFIGKVTSFSPTYDNVLAITGDTVNGVNTITNIAALDPSYDLSLLRVGQIVNSIQGGFAADVTITNINGTTLTVSSTANVSQTGNIFGIDTPPGTYFFNSASLIDPKSVITVNDITGSNDEDFNIDLSPVYAIIGQAASSLGGPALPATFHLYKVSEVTYRDIGSAQLSGFIAWGEQGVEADSGEFLYTAASQVLAIGAMSTTSSNVTIYDNASIDSTPAGSSVAGYQIALPTIIDQAITSSAGAGFPFTGSADITGSLQITGSVIIEQPVGNVNAFLIKSGSLANSPALFKLDSKGVAQFFAHSNDYVPTPVLGGLYFTSQSVYVGIE